MLSVVDVFCFWYGDVVKVIELLYKFVWLMREFWDRNGILDVFLRGIFIRVLGVVVEVNWKYFLKW